MLIPPLGGFKMDMDKILKTVVVWAIFLIVIYIFGHYYIPDPY